MQSFQKEDWRAREFDKQFADEMKGVDCKTAFEEEGDVNYTYSHMEHVMKEIATELWQMVKKKNQREEESKEKI